MESLEFGNFSCVLGEIRDRETLTLEYWDIELDGEEDYVMIIIYLVILFTGVPLNSLIMTRIIIKQLYKNPSYQLLLNLAICDLLICLVLLLFNTITEFRGSLSFGRSDYARCQVCKIAAFYIMLNFQTIFNLLLISLDRFIYFKYSIRYDSLVNTKTILAALGVVWLLSFVLIIPPLAGYGDIVLSASCGTIFIQHPTHRRRSIPYIAIAIVIHSAVLAALIVTNVWILSIGLKQIKTLRVQPTEGWDIEHKDSNRDREVAKKQLRILYIFGAILTVHFLTLIPAMVLVAVVAFSASGVPPAAYTVVLLSITSQATLHPLVEALSLPELRKLITKCRGVCPRSNRSEEMHLT